MDAVTTLKDVNPADNNNPPSPAHSTVGAGDTFIAAILYGMVLGLPVDAEEPDRTRNLRVVPQSQRLGNPRDEDLDKLLAFAVRLATKKVQMEGFGGLLDEF